ncbi:MAG: 3-phosphoshikimate 1-carboxyvinyltransferase [Alphaproteobacteria bacterium]|nr:3-phosphoshikimate 1-carboxyvinyltransferase [Alphaproteobacteria bacterium]
MISATSSGLQGDVSVPGDKSISHRALMLASQVLGSTRITGLLEGEDVLRTAEALRRLGVDVQRVGDGAWEVHGVGAGGLHESEAVLDMGNAGTGARLMMGLVTPYPFTTFFTGDPSLRSRPMGRVMTPLSQMGARFVARAHDRLPLALTGTESPLPITYRLPVASAQVKSAVLLAALNTRGKTTVIEREPTRDHTENMLEYFGIGVERRREEDGALAVTLSGHQNPARAERSLTVPGDPSSAAFPLVAALIVPHSRLVLRNVCVNPLRTGLFDTLKEMGARLTAVNERRIGGEKVADIEVESSTLRAVRVPAARAPSMIDEYPILAVAAAFAEGETAMEGIGELRVKESDRLSGIIQGLRACGVEARAEGDTLFVTGQKQPRGGALISTRLDHRIAMSFLVMGMASQQHVTVDDAAPIATSFPGFPALMNALGARLSERTPTRTLPLVVAIDGPAASGKGTLARRLAAYFGIAYLDTGSLYRAVGLRLAYADADPRDIGAAIRAAQSITYEDLANPRLRQEHVGKAASIVSAQPEVRAVLLDFQRRFAASGQGAILDGRDIGTVVLPEARFKFFITATLEARARRRHRELQGQGVEVIYDSVLKDLRERDERDAAREIAPMKPAEDAFIIDTSKHDADSVFDQVRRLIEERLEQPEQRIPA